MTQILGFGEHVLAEHSRVHAGNRNRTDVMETPGLEGICQLQRIARAVDIGDDLAFRVGAQVVDCSEVKQVLDLAG